MGWRETIAALLGFVWPWRRQLAVVVLCGIGRVAAFIGVGVLGALTIGAVRAGAPTTGLVIALLVAAPLAALLHWLESWLAHDMAYPLLAEMRVDLYRKLDALAPAYLLHRRSGDIVALATQDVETVEYFFAHTVAPALRRRAGAAQRAGDADAGSPGRWRWRCCRSLATPRPRRCSDASGSIGSAPRRAVRWASWAPT